MTQQSSATLVLASLTLAGGLRYPSALGHLIRTASVAAHLAGLMGLGGDEQLGIYLTAPVHDVGKLGIPDAILLKPGALSDDEHEVMQRHSSIGADLLAGSGDALLQQAATVARHHHERFDGGGYPSGLAGEGIPRAARIVAVADAFDAMLEPRVYRTGMQEDHALAELDDRSGAYFDPDVVEVFLKDVTGIQRARAAADALVAKYGVFSAVSRFYGARGPSPAFLEHLRTLA